MSEAGHHHSATPPAEAGEHQQGTGRTGGADSPPGNDNPPNDPDRIYKDLRILTHTDKTGGAELHPDDREVIEVAHEQRDGEMLAAVRDALLYQDAPGQHSLPSADEELRALAEDPAQPTGLRLGAALRLGDRDLIDSVREKADSAPHNTPAANLSDTPREYNRANSGTQKSDETPERPGTDVLPETTEDLRIRALDTSKELWERLAAAYKLGDQSVIDSVHHAAQTRAGDAYTLPDTDQQLREIAEDNSGHFWRRLAAAYKLGDSTLVDNLTSSRRDAAPKASRYRLPSDPGALRNIAMDPSKPFAYRLEAAYASGDEEIVEALRHEWTPHEQTLDAVSIDGLRQLMRSARYHARSADIARTLEIRLAQNPEVAVPEQSTKLSDYSVGKLLVMLNDARAKNDTAAYNETLDELASRPAGAAKLREVAQSAMSRGDLSEMAKINSLLAADDRSRQATESDVVPLPRAEDSSAERQSLEPATRAKTDIDVEPRTQYEPSPSETADPANIDTANASDQRGVVTHSVRPGTAGLSSIPDYSGHDLTIGSSPNSDALTAADGTSVTANVQRSEPISTTGRHSADAAAHVPPLVTNAGSTTLALSAADGVDKPSLAHASSRPPLPRTTTVTTVTDTSNNGSRFEPELNMADGSTTISGPGPDPEGMPDRPRTTTSTEQSAGLVGDTRNDPDQATVSPSNNGNGDNSGHSSTLAGEPTPWEESLSYAQGTPPDTIVDDIRELLTRRNVPAADTPIELADILAWTVLYGLAETGRPIVTLRLIGATSAMGSNLKGDVSGRESEEPTDTPTEDPLVWIEYNPTTPSSAYHTAITLRLDSENDPKRTNAILEGCVRLAEKFDAAEVRSIIREALDEAIRTARATSPHKYRPTTNLVLEIEPDQLAVSLASDRQVPSHDDLDVGGVESPAARPTAGQPRRTARPVAAGENADLHTTLTSLPPEPKISQGSSSITDPGDGLWRPAEPDLGDQPDPTASTSQWAHDDIASTPESQPPKPSLPTRWLTRDQWPSFDVREVAGEPWTPRISSNSSSIQEPIVADDGTWTWQRSNTTSDNTTNRSSGQPLTASVRNPLDAPWVPPQAIAPAASFRVNEGLDFLKAPRDVRGLFDVRNAHGEDWRPVIGRIGSRREPEPVVTVDGDVVWTRPENTDRPKSVEVASRRAEAIDQSAAESSSREFAHGASKQKNPTLRDAEETDERLRFFEPTPQPDEAPQWGKADPMSWPRNPPGSFAGYGGESASEGSESDRLLMHGHHVIPHVYRAGERVPLVFTGASAPDSSHRGLLLPGDGVYEDVIRTIPSISNLALLKSNKHYRWLIEGQIANGIGSAVMRSALPLEIKEMTHSMSIAGFVSVSPWLAGLVAPIAGEIGRQRDPKNLMLIANIGAAGATTIALLEVLSHAPFAAEVLALAAGAEGIFTTVIGTNFRPVSQGLLGPSEQVAGNQINATSPAIAQFIGSAIAPALLISGAPFAIDAASYAANIAILMALGKDLPTGPSRRSAGDEPKRNILQGIRESAALLGRNAPLLELTVSASIARFAAGAENLRVVELLSEGGSSPLLKGLEISATALGAMTRFVWPQWANHLIADAGSRFNLALLGGYTVAMGLDAASAAFPATFAGQFLTGALAAAATTQLYSIQTKTVHPDDLGGVNSLQLAAFSLLSASAAAITGVGLAHLGPEAVAYLIEFLMGGTTATTGLLLLRRRDKVVRRRSAVESESSRLEVTSRSGKRELRRRYDGNLEVAQFAVNEMADMVENLAALELAGFDPQVLFLDKNLKYVAATCDPRFGPLYRQTRAVDAAQLRQLIAAAQLESDNSADARAQLTALLLDAGLRVKNENTVVIVAGFVQTDYFSERLSELFHNAGWLPSLPLFSNYRRDTLDVAARIVGAMAETNLGQRALRDAVDHAASRRAAGKDWRETVERATDHFVAQVETWISGGQANARFASVLAALPELISELRKTGAVARAGHSYHTSAVTHLSSAAVSGSEPDFQVRYEGASSPTERSAEVPTATEQTPADWQYDKATDRALGRLLGGRESRGDSEPYTGINTGPHGLDVAGFPETGDIYGGPSDTPRISEKVPPTNSSTGGEQPDEAPQWRKTDPMSWPGSSSGGLVGYGGERGSDGGGNGPYLRSPAEGDEPELRDDPDAVNVAAGTSPVEVERTIEVMAPWWQTDARRRAGRAVAAVIDELAPVTARLELAQNGDLRLIALCHARHTGTRSGVPETVIANLAASAEEWSVAPQDGALRLDASLVYHPTAAGDIGETDADQVRRIAEFATVSRRVTLLEDLALSVREQLVVAAGQVHGLATEVLSVLWSRGSVEVDMLVDALERVRVETQRQFGAGPVLLVSTVLAPSFVVVVVDGYAARGAYACTALVQVRVQPENGTPKASLLIDSSQLAAAWVDWWPEDHPMSRGRKPGLIYETDSAVFNEKLREYLSYIVPEGREPGSENAQVAWQPDDDDIAAVRQMIYARSPQDWGIELIDAATIHTFALAKFRGLHSRPEISRLAAYALSTFQVEDAARHAWVKAFDERVDPRHSRTNSLLSAANPTMVHDALELLSSVERDCVFRLDGPISADDESVVALTSALQQVIEESAHRPPADRRLESRAASRSSRSKSPDRNPWPFDLASALEQADGVRSHRDLIEFAGQLTSRFPSYCKLRPLGKSAGGATMWLFSVEPEPRDAEWALVYTSTHPWERLSVASLTTLMEWWATAHEARNIGLDVLLELDVDKVLVVEKLVEEVLQEALDKGRSMTDFECAMRAHHRPGCTASPEQIAKYPDLARKTRPRQIEWDQDPEFPETSIFLATIGLRGYRTIESWHGADYGFPYRLVGNVHDGLESASRVEKAAKECGFDFRYDVTDGSGGDRIKPGIYLRAAEPFENIYEIACRARERVLREFPERERRYGKDVKFGITETKIFEHTLDPQITIGEFVSIWGARAEQLEDLYEPVEESQTTIFYESAYGLLMALKEQVDEMRGKIEENPDVANRIALCAYQFDQSLRSLSEMLHHCRHRIRNGTASPYLIDLEAILDSRMSDWCGFTEEKLRLRRVSLDRVARYQASIFIDQVLSDRGDDARPDAPEAIDPGAPSPSGSGTTERHDSTQPPRLLAGDSTSDQALADDLPSADALREVPRIERVAGSPGVTGPESNIQLRHGGANPWLFKALGPGAVVEPRDRLRFLEDRWEELEAPQWGFSRDPFSWPRNPPGNDADHGKAFKAKRPLDLFPKRKSRTPRIDRGSCDSGIEAPPAATPGSPHLYTRDAEGNWSLGDSSDTGQAVQGHVSLWSLLHRNHTFALTYGIDVTDAFRATLLPVAAPEITSNPQIAGWMNVGDGLSQGSALLLGPALDTHGPEWVMKRGALVGATAALGAFGAVILHAPHLNAVLPIAMLVESTAGISIALGAQRIFGDSLRPEERSTGNGAQAMPLGKIAGTLVAPALATVAHVLPPGLDVLLWGAEFMALRSLRNIQPRRAEELPRRLLNDIVLGHREVVKDEFLRGYLGASVLSNIAFGGLSVYYQSAVYGSHLPGWSKGFLLAVNAGGGIAGMFRPNWMKAILDESDPRKYYWWTLLGSAVLTTASAVSDSLVLMTPTLFALGWSSVNLNRRILSHQQKEIPEHAAGRVGAEIFATSSAAIALGSLVGTIEHSVWIPTLSAILAGAGYGARILWQRANPGPRHPNSESAPDDLPRTNEFRWQTESGGNPMPSLDDLAALHRTSGEPVVVVELGANDIAGLHKLQVGLRQQVRAAAVRPDVGLTAAATMTDLIKGLVWLHTRAKTRIKVSVTGYGAVTVDMTVAGEADFAKTAAREITAEQANYTMIVAWPSRREMHIRLVFGPKSPGGDRRKVWLVDAADYLLERIDDALLAAFSAPAVSPTAWELVETFVRRADIGIDEFAARLGMTRRAIEMAVTGSRFAWCDLSSAMARHANDDVVAQVIRRIDELADRVGRAGVLRAISDIVGQYDLPWERGQEATACLRALARIDRKPMTASAEYPGGGMVSLCLAWPGGGPSTATLLDRAGDVLSTAPYCLVAQDNNSRVAEIRLVFNGDGATGRDGIWIVPASWPWVWDTSGAVSRLILHTVRTAAGKAEGELPTVWHPDQMGDVEAASLESVLPYCEQCDRYDLAKDVMSVLARPQLSIGDDQRGLTDELTRWRTEVLRVLKMSGDTTDIPEAGRLAVEQGTIEVEPTFLADWALMRHSSQDDLDRLTWIRIAHSVREKREWFEGRIDPERAERALALMSRRMFGGLSPVELAHLLGEQGEAWSAQRVLDVENAIVQISPREVRAWDKACQAKNIVEQRKTKIRETNPAVQSYLQTHQAVQSYVQAKLADAIADLSADLLKFRERMDAPKSNTRTQNRTSLRPARQPAETDVLAQLAWTFNDNSNHGRRTAEGSLLARRAVGARLQALRLQDELSTVAVEWWSGLPTFRINQIESGNGPRVSEDEIRLIGRVLSYRPNIVIDMIKMLHATDKHLVDFADRFTTQAVALQRRAKNSVAQPAVALRSTRWPGSEETRDLHVRKLVTLLELNVDPGDVAAVRMILPNEERLDSARWHDLLDGLGIPDQPEELAWVGMTSAQLKAMALRASRSLQLRALCVLVNPDPTLAGALLLRSPIGFDGIHNPELRSAMRSVANALLDEDLHASSPFHGVPMPSFRSTILANPAEGWVLSRNFQSNLNFHDADLDRVTRMALTRLVLDRLDASQGELKVARSLRILRKTDREWAVHRLARLTGLGNPFLLSKEGFLEALAKKQHNAFRKWKVLIEHRRLNVPSRSAILDDHTEAARVVRQTLRLHLLESITNFRPIPSDLLELVSRPNSNRYENYPLKNLRGNLTTLRPAIDQLIDAELRRNLSLSVDTSVDDLDTVRARLIADPYGPFAEIETFTGRLHELLLMVVLARHFLDEFQSDRVPMGDDTVVVEIGDRKQLQISAPRPVGALGSHAAITQFLRQELEGAVGVSEIEDAQIAGSLLFDHLLSSHISQDWWPPVFGQSDPLDWQPRTASIEAWSVGSLHPSALIQYRDQSDEESDIPLLVESLRMYADRIDVIMHGEGQGRTVLAYLKFGGGDRGAGAPPTYQGAVRMSRDRLVAELDSERRRVVEREERDRPKHRSTGDTSWVAQDPNVPAAIRRVRAKNIDFGDYDHQTLLAWHLRIQATNPPPLPYVDTTAEILGHTIEVRYLLGNLSEPSHSVKDEMARQLLEFASDENSDIPIVAITTGNFGYALALKATQVRRKIIIFMPETAHPVKVKAFRDLGIEVNQIGRDYNECHEYVQTVWSYDNAGLIVDQEAVSMQAAMHYHLIQHIIEHPGEFGTVFVPIGNGSFAGTIAGKILTQQPRPVAQPDSERFLDADTNTLMDDLAARTIAALRSGVDLVGVAPQNAPAFTESFRFGEPVFRPSFTIADSAAHSEPSSRMVEAAIARTHHIVVMPEKFIRPLARQLTEILGHPVDPTAALAAYGPTLFYQTEVATSPYYLPPREELGIDTAHYWKPKDGKMLVFITGGRPGTADGVPDYWNLDLTSTGRPLDENDELPRDSAEAGQGTVASQSGPPYVADELAEAATVFAELDILVAPDPGIRQTNLRRVRQMIGRELVPVEDLDRILTEMVTGARRRAVLLADSRIVTLIDLEGAATVFDSTMPGRMSLTAWSKSPAKHSLGTSDKLLIDDGGRLPDPAEDRCAALLDAVTSTPEERDQVKKALELTYDYVSLAMRNENGEPILDLNGKPVREHGFDPTRTYSAIIVCGSLDEGVPSLVANLVRSHGLTRRVVFTGYQGEAERFAIEAQKTGLNVEYCIQESEATNTRENIEKSIILLEDLGCEISNILAISHPPHMRRLLEFLREARNPREADKRRLIPEDATISVASVAVGFEDYLNFGYRSGDPRLPTHPGSIAVACLREIRGLHKPNNPKYSAKPWPSAELEAAYELLEPRFDLDDIHTGGVVLSVPGDTGTHARLTPNSSGNALLPDAGSVVADGDGRPPGIPALPVVNLKSDRSDGIRTEASNSRPLAIDPGLRTDTNPWMLRGQEPGVVMGRERLRFLDPRWEPHAPQWGFVSDPFSWSRNPPGSEDAYGQADSQV
ncbi:pyridoxal-phosphate dependent enzyme [Nocardia sp. CDC160]|uniref:pyridoxal-phosphate dependent enzyme n=1 Tax=Nocardia sp. CDC160 TaxID=3112166 RepID=UPI002DBBA66B|nr:pyridoxal-phosphate dependent enzyme [Nocardia sp. CDC160]MEC3920336.1 pyridoxal-phosphate dependent enzyme [Nocardia sp. CDC160]